MEELECDVAIRQARSALDARAAHALRCKTEVIVEEARQATRDIMQDASKVRTLQSTLHVHHTHLQSSKFLTAPAPIHSFPPPQASRVRARQAAEYEYELSQSKVDSHSMRQEMMVLQLRLSAAQDDLVRRKAAADILGRQMTLESSAARAVAAQNTQLREKVARLQARLQESWEAAAVVKGALAAELVEREAELEALYEQVRHDGAQGLRLRDELVLAERAAAAARERAALAEDRLRHSEAIASERATLQASMQNYSQEVAKMAMQSGNAATTRALADAQDEAAEERRGRAAAEARAEALEKQVAQLKRDLKAKDRHVGRLEEALQARDVATPAVQAVDAARDAVGGLISQLDDDTPGADMSKFKPAPALLGGGKRGGGAKAKAPLSAVAEDASDDDRGRDPDFGEENSPPKKAAAAKKKAKAAADEGVGAAPKRKRASLAGLVAAAKEANAAADGGSSKEEGEPKDKKARKEKKRALPKFDLQSVWGAGDKENADAGAGAPAAKLSHRPLEALNPAAVAAAANQARPKLAAPPAGGMKRPLLGVSGKRPLLGLSSAAMAEGGGLPAAQLLLGRAQAPQLKPQLQKPMQ